MNKTIERHRYDGNDIIETRVLEFEPWSLDEIEEVLNLIQSELTVDLLKGKKLMYPEDKGINRFYGHCYHATQALYYMIDSDELESYSGEDYRGEKHWWLQHGETVYDCTAEQYWDVKQDPPYNAGKKTKWYGWKGRPQQISLDLCVRVLGSRLKKDYIKD
tara:strand:+ start:295 stop:777 length:483 start_codon:yes stop_codon:yes gene_type:complete